MFLGVALKESTRLDFISSGLGAASFAFAALGVWSVASLLDNHPSPLTVERNGSFYLGMILIALAGNRVCARFEKRWHERFQNAKRAEREARQSHGGSPDQASRPAFSNEVGDKGSAGTKHE